MPEHILLLNPPGDKLYIRDYYCSFSSKADYYWPPQDLIVLSGLLDAAFRIQVLDAIIDKVGPEDCLRRILEGGFQAVLFTTGTATLKADLALVDRVKAARPSTTIIASAGILKFVGEKLLRENACLDACLTDFTEPDLLAYLSGRRGEPLRGLIHRRGEELVGPAPSPDRQFEVPVPRHDLFSFRKYRIPIARRLPFSVVVTSLGCPYHCGFCTAGAYGYKARPVDNVIPELQALARLGVREILFQDPTLSINTNRVVELCRKMLEAGLRLTWSCNADVHSLNEEKISWMKKAGCHTVSIGIESGDDALLKKYSKPITTAEIKETIRLLNTYGLRVLGYFILGLPGETREMALRTIDLAKTLNIDIASFAIATPDLGTRLREEAVAKGWIPADLDSWDSTDYPLIASGDMTPEEIWRMRRKAVR
ncbi:MAG: radical SAM protein, partial [Candidatus Aminicenantes bacterium]|nr:radical SAM protein [Candidatus Aminicenantes bacterium]